MPGLLQFGGVERWRGIDDGLLAGVEVGEVVAGEVAEAAAATLGRLLARPTRKALAADLDDIAQASERGS